MNRISRFGLLGLLWIFCVVFPVFGQSGLTWTRMTSAEALGIGFVYKFDTSVLLGINSMINGSSPLIDKLYRSADNGATWTLVLPNENFSGFARANGRLYAITNSQGANYNTTKFITSADGGATWSQLSTLPPLMFIQPTTNPIQSTGYQPGSISKIIVNGSTILIVQMSKERIFISQNGGVTFTETATNVPKNATSSLRFFDCILTKNGSYLLSLSENSLTPPNPTTPMLWRSTNGATWQPVTTTPAAYRGADELHQLSNGDIYGSFARTGTAFANDWLKSTDAGSTWTPMPYPPGATNLVIGRSGFPLGNNLFTINAGTTSVFDGTSWQSATTLTSAAPLPRAVATKVVGFISPMSDVPNDEVFVSESSIFGTTLWRSTPGAPPPVIMSLNLQSIGAGGSVILTGTNFNNVSAVRFGTVNATSFTVVSPTQITAVVPASLAPGMYAVSVVVAGGVTGTSQTQLIVNAAPAITSFTPTSGGAGTIVTLTGNGFSGVNSVTIGSGVRVRTFSVLNNTSMTLTIPTVSFNPEPALAITLTSPNGTGTSMQTFSYFPPPVMSSFAPQQASPGTQVTITGQNLSGVTALRIGTLAVTGFTVVDANTIRFTVPTGTQTGRLGVTGQYGQAETDNALAIVISSVRQEVGMSGNVYPNPAEQSLTVESRLKSAQELSLEVRDMVGRIVAKTSYRAASGDFRTTLDVSNYAAGMYIVQLTGHDGTRFVQSFIKQ